MMRPLRFGPDWRRLPTLRQWCQQPLSAVPIPCRRSRGGPSPNSTDEFCSDLGSSTGLRWIGDGHDDLAESVGPDDFCYVVVLVAKNTCLLYTSDAADDLLC